MLHIMREVTPSTCGGQTPITFPAWPFPSPDFTSAAKAAVDFATLAARLKPRPFKA